MPKNLILVCLGLAAMLAIGTAAPAIADDGCTRALAATAGTPGLAFVQAHCVSPSPPPETPPVSTPTGPQTAVQGCAIGLAAATGTPGEPFVRAACDRLAGQVGVPVPAPVKPPASDNGCAIAELTTRGTEGHAWVVANCGQPGAAAAAGAQSVAAGCDRAIQAVVGTTAEPFVRVGCAQAVASAAAASEPPPDANATIGEQPTETEPQVDTDPGE